MSMLTLPEKRGKTKLAYITDSERKLLRRRDAVSGKKAPEYSEEGVPVLQAAERQWEEQQAAAQKLRREQKAAGWKTEYYGGGEQAWVPPTKKKTAPKKKAAPAGSIPKPVPKKKPIIKVPATSPKKKAAPATKPVKMPETKHSKKHQYKKQYTDMAGKNKDYNKYVDSYKDLSNAYEQIKNNPNSKQAQYWLPRMANMSKEAFGKAHAGESMALQSRTYRGATSAMGKKARAVPNRVAATTTTTTAPTTTEPTVTQPTSGGPTTTATTGGPTSTLNIDPGGDSSPIIAPLMSAVIIEGAESEIVQERIKDLINTNSPLFKAATTKALQSMNASGLVNSSMAQEAVMSSIMAVAIPIAQADAATFTEQRMANQNASNAFKAQQNAAYYQAFVTRLNGQINQTLRNLSERAANWRAVLNARAQIATQPGMSTDAAGNAIKLITPTWFD